MVLVLVTVALFAVGLRWESVGSLNAGAGGSTADTVAKAIVHRARPSADIVHVVQVFSGYSFPIWARTGLATCWAPIFWAASGWR